MHPARPDDNPRQSTRTCTHGTVESLKPEVRWSVEERRVILNPHLLAEEDLLEPNLRQVVKSIAVTLLFSDSIHNIFHWTSV